MDFLETLKLNYAATTIIFGITLSLIGTLVDGGLLRHGWIQKRRLLLIWTFALGFAFYVRYKYPDPQIYCLAAFLMIGVVLSLHQTDLRYSAKKGRWWWTRAEGDYHVDGQKNN